MAVVLLEVVSKPGYNPQKPWLQVSVRVFNPSNHPLSTLPLSVTLSGGLGFGGP